MCTTILARGRAPVGHGARKLAWSFECGALVGVSESTSRRAIGLAIGPEHLKFSLNNLGIRFKINTGKPTIKVFQLSLKALIQSG